MLDHGVGEGLEHWMMPDQDEMDLEAEWYHSYIKSSALETDTFGGFAHLFHMTLNTLINFSELPLFHQKMEITVLVP